MDLKEYDDAYGPTLETAARYLPDDRPPLELLSPFLLRDLERLPDPKKRIVAWTAAMATAFERSGLWKGIPGYRFAAFGLANPKAEKAAFAVLAYANPDVGRFARFELQIGNIPFPVFVRPAFQLQHAPTLNPSGGRTTCLATSSSLSNPVLLTAHHVLENQLNRRPTKGDTVALIDAQGQTVNGTVALQTPGQIDAAVVEPTGTLLSASGSNLNPERYVAPWEDVEIEFARGAVLSKVTSVTDTRGSMDPRMDIRIFFTVHGQTGDSGTLVLKTARQDAVAIYAGEIAALNGIDEGWGQHLGQVCDAMNLSLLTG